MNTVGISKAETVFKKELRNGGTAVLTDGKITCAIAEERVTGIKQAPGFERSIQRALQAAKMQEREIDRIGVSTCCEPERNALSGHRFAGDPRLVSVNHHLSHAAFAFYASGFQKALVVVADGGGNVLSHESDPVWWRQPREQHSYYKADRQQGLELIDRDLSGPFEVGFGEMYRAFTHFLGWPSSRHASRLMSLAAHGRPDAFKQDIYELSVDGNLISQLQNDPMQPVDMVLGLGELLQVDFGEPRSPGEEILPIHADVAAFIQKQLELAFVRKLHVLHRMHRFDNLCLGGGVALNVLANGRLVREAICSRVYVPPAPADDGQCVGNALVASMNGRGSSPLSTHILVSSGSALGPEPQVDSGAVSEALHRAGKTRYAVFENPNLPQTIARFLQDGSAVIIFNGRSEFGPRALGQRSILGDPRNQGVRPLLNGIKAREWFMPFAPAVLAEYVNEWFEHNVSSPFMSFALNVKPDRRHLVPAVVSQDGTSRLQTLSADDKSLLRNTVEEFERLTGVPLVLNTSFNLGGKPIVETVDDAIHTFAKIAVNVMVLGRFIIAKSMSPALAEMGILPTSYPIHDVTVVKREERIPVSSSRISSRQIIRRIQEETGAVVFVRHEFPLYGPYLEWLRQGRKVTTIRFRKGGVEIPKDEELSLFETPDYGVAESRRPAAIVRVRSIRYQKFGELTPKDARRDGFSSLPEMRSDFQKIYPKLQKDDWVTIYRIELVKDLKLSEDKA